MTMSVTRKPRSAAALARLSAPLAITCFVVVGLSYVTNAMDRQVFSVLLPGIQKEYGFDLSQGGLLSTIFTLGIGVAGIPGSYLLNRFSRKSVIIVGIAIYSIFTLLTALSVSFGDMFVYRALSGVGEAIQNAALFSAVGAYFFRQRALAVGSLNFAYGLGAFIGPRFGGQLEAISGQWRTPFYVFAALGLAFAVIITVVVTKRFTEQAEQGHDATAADERLFAHMPERLYNRNVVVLGIVSAVVGVSVYGYLGLYPTFLQTVHHFSVVESGTAVGMYGFGALMGIPAGLLGDRVNQRWILIVSLVAGSVIGFLLFNGPGTPVAQNWLSFLEGTVGSGLLFTNTYSAMQRSVRPHFIGRVSGFFVSAWYLPSALAGYLFASLHNGFGWGGASIVQLSLVPFIGVIALFFLDMRRVSNAKVASLEH
ncbi:MAG TPA: MFS transporter [Gryllotalpicola sp.]